MQGSAFDPDRLAIMHESMARHAGTEGLPGFVTLINRSGETDAQAYGTMATGSDVPVREDTIFRIASVTKPIVAAVAMALIEDGTLRLDDPVDTYLPELANRQVLRSIESELNDTVPADRPITLRDLLTLTPGYGAIFAMPGTYPIQQAMEEAGLAPGPNTPAMSADEMLQRYADLPLVAQPGTRWLYNNGLDLLGILLARASDVSLGELLQERVFAPLGMIDTAFSVPQEKADRLPGVYFRDPASGEVVEFDVAGPESDFATPPVFESGAGGLVSTAADLLAFAEMMRGYGTRDDVRVLSRASVTLMTTNQIKPEQTNAADFFPGFWQTHGWGFGVAIDTARTELFTSPGRYGWDGGFGTSLYIDPAEDVIGILLTQQAWDGTGLPRAYLDFWNGTYQAFA
ncbi:MAG: serine hydrolase domain-containing protein [Thermomicrobiales bacterium]